MKKLGSVKVWITLWCMILISYIVLADLASFNNLAMLAIAPILTYIGANVLQDKIYLDNKNGK